ncbi:hypothetical protein MY11210_002166 [Beauveria gryllotalpidicola]
MSPRSPHYIPVGCLAVPRSEINLKNSPWQADAAIWKPLVRPDKSNSDRIRHDTAQRGGTSSILQKALLQSAKLVAQLLDARWAQFEYRTFPEFDNTTVVRVYFLADDALRGSISRALDSLHKNRFKVLTEVDSSARVWAGLEKPLPYKRNPLVLASLEESTTPTSLLELFNNIPSPAPDTSAITDPLLNQATQNVLKGKISGLKSELLSYQKQSIALMIQKEACPGRVLDPRLVHLHDRNDHSWYVDPVAKTVLRDARYYDAVSGGILAEEMGTGKTIICLALVLATRAFPAEAPEVYWSPALPVRKSVGSLMDMAASCATRNSQSWISYYGHSKKEDFKGTAIANAIQRNPSSYLLPGAKSRKRARGGSNFVALPKTIYLSSISLVIVPENLLSQWQQEISDHTEDLEVLVLAQNDVIPKTEILLEYDILLLSRSRFDKVVKSEVISKTPLASIHFKRCIVDEGHILGNSKFSNKSLLLQGLDDLQFTSRWVVTGTPSRGLYGASGQSSGDTLMQQGTFESLSVAQSSAAQERKDIDRLGAIAALYLKARPWATSASEASEMGDSLAKWAAHFGSPTSVGSGWARRWNCLKLTINSLILRHQLHEVLDLLPPVDEKIVLLDGSYQDMLSLNIFAMMIIFNSVQSQRTDADYFFHAKQRKSLLQIVHNLKQSSFFGGSFFSVEEIEKAVQTAEEFLEKKQVEINAEDEALLKTAIDFGHLVSKNDLRILSNRFHEMPICVAGFPGGAGRYWSLDGEEDGVICTSASMILTVQKMLYKAASEAISDAGQLNSLLNGGLIQNGLLERSKVETEAAESTRRATKKSTTLAGNTKLGNDQPKSLHRYRCGIHGAEPAPVVTDGAFACALAETKLVSTVSAKLSYLIDSVVKHQADEKIIIFYENENVAWYLANMLDMLEIQHLIYSRTLDAGRRAEYVKTFHHNARFRVLLMDISKAAFGLDMHAASRVYFINPVLNPQVQSQAIARVRRISQHRGVSVETLVLKGSIDEVIVDCKEHMTQAEHVKAKAILDVSLIKDWIRNAKIVRVGEAPDSHAAQMVPLAMPLPIFGKGFGRLAGPDEGLVKDEAVAPKAALPDRAATWAPSGQKRVREEEEDTAKRPARRVRFTGESESP